MPLAATLVVACRLVPAAAGACAGAERPVGADLARDMVRRDFFDHVSPGGSTPAQRAHAAGFGGASIGETIAWSTGAATPASIVRMWMRSPPHRHVLLAPLFSALGIGTTRGAPGHGSAGATFTADLGG